MGHFALIQFMGTLSPKTTFELNRRIMGMETAAETKERAIEAPSGDSKAKGTKVLHTMSDRIVELVEEMNCGPWEEGKQHDAFDFKSVAIKLREEWENNVSAAIELVEKAESEGARSAAESELTELKDAVLLWDCGNMIK